MLAVAPEDHHAPAAPVLREHLDGLLGEVFRGPVLRRDDDAGDERALRIYQTIGTCLGYAVAHWADFYDLRHLLILGRVTTGQGGDVILAEARRALDVEFPELSGRVAFHVPDEKEKRHGQAIAAASLPAIGRA